ncbi:carboxypeptidase-like regulatory domain-containing protein [uncultured Rubinisphaera sp.]|uniref:carboxypeptidase-like regulatory domain-containing protein n=1 Tax=uncultured Rubinisphaera sp. TaxID=1678686 RepID=UPI0030DAF2E1
MQRSPAFYFVYIPIAMLLLFVFGLAIILMATGTRFVATPVPATPADIFYEEGKGRLKGKIILEDGSPNTEKVQLSYDSKRVTGTSSSSYSASGPQVTDSFDLEAQSGETYLMFISSNYTPAWLGPLENHADGLIDDLVVVLKKGVPLDISLTDENGNPIIDANVNGFPILNDGGGQHIPFKATQAGVYRIENVNDLTYKIFVEADGFEPTSFKIENPDKVGLYNKELVKADPTSGTVIGADNQPVANAKFLLYVRAMVVGGNTSGTHCWSGKEIGVTDEQGKFELDDLMSDHEHSGIIEAPDKRRIPFTNLTAGSTGLVYEMPPQRTLHGKITGDLAQLHDRYFNEFKENRPYIKVDQEYTYSYGSSNHSNNLHDYIPLDQQAAEATFACPGIFSEKVEVLIGPYRVEFNPNDYASQGDLLLEFNLDNGEKTIRSYKAPANLNEQEN